MVRRHNFPFWLQKIARGWPQFEDFSKAEDQSLPHFLLVLANYADELEKEEILERKYWIDKYNHNKYFALGIFNNPDDSSPPSSYHSSIEDITVPVSWLNRYK